MTRSAALRSAAAGFLGAALLALAIASHPFRTSPTELAARWRVLLLDDGRDVSRPTTVEPTDEPQNARVAPVSPARGKRSARTKRAAPPVATGAAPLPLLPPPAASQDIGVAALVSP